MMTATKGVRLHHSDEYLLWSQLDEIQKLVDVSVSPSEDDVREWRMKVYKIMEPKRFQYLCYAMENYNELMRDFDRILFKADSENKGMGEW